MFQANVNIDYRKAAVGITITILIATMFFGMIPPVLGEAFIISTPATEGTPGSFVTTPSVSDDGLGQAVQGAAQENNPVEIIHCIPPCGGGR